MLIIFFGNIGTGKTSLAKITAKKLSFELVYFDNEVKQVFNNKKIYDENDNFLLNNKEILKVYDFMFNKTKNLLKNNKNVVLESMFFKKQRKKAISLAKASKITYILIEVICDESIIKARLNERKKINPQTPGYNLYIKYRYLMDKEKSDHIIIDTSNKSIEDSLKEVINKIKEI
jgi:predicted kinase